MLKVCTWNQGINEWSCSRSQQTGWTYWFSYKKKKIVHYYLDTIVIDINKGKENVDEAHKEILLANEFSKKARNKL